MSLGILPCPFCEFVDVEICEVEPGRIAIDCPECECIGPFADSVEGAAAMWNKPTVERRADQRRMATVTELLQRYEVVEIRGRALAQREDPAAEIDRMRDRIECLRGALKTASGWIWDGAANEAEADDRAKQLIEMAGDMEAP